MAIPSSDVSDAASAPPAHVSDDDEEEEDDDGVRLRDPRKRREISLLVREIRARDARSRFLSARSGRKTRDLACARVRAWRTLSVGAGAP